MRYRLLLVILFTLNILLLFAQQKTAQDSSIQNQHQYLNDVVVSTKNNLKNINTAKTVETISVEKLRSNGINSMYGMLNTASGVYMVDMGNEQHSMSIRLPMNYSPLYNYLENGIPLRPVGIFNNNELLELNKFSIQKIEVVKGPFSEGYGAQSIGASINFIQNSFDKANKEVMFQSNGYGQIEALYQTKAVLGKTKFLFNVNHSQRNINEDYHFNYSKQAFSFRFERAIGKKDVLVLQSNWMNYYGHQRDGYDSTNFYNKNYNSFDRFSDRLTWAIRNTLELKHSYNSKHYLNITLFNRVVFEKQNPFYLISYDYTNPLTTSATGQITTDEFTSYGLNINHAISNKKGNLTYNQTLYFDFTPNNFYKSTFINVTRSNGVNVSYSSTDSLLTNYKANLKNIALSTSIQYFPTNKIIVYAGLRGDLLAYNFTNYLSNTAYSGAPSGNNSFYSINLEASFAYKIKNNQSVFAQFSSGFTPPTLSNLYRGVTTPTLSPAKYYNTEIGYKYFTKIYTLTISLYNMNGIDEFVSVYRPAGNIDVINAGKTNHKGIELQLQYHQNNFEVTYNSSYSKHTFKDYTDYGVKYNGNTMNSAPNYLHYANVTYTIPSVHQLKFIAEWTKVGGYQINAANTKQYEGYNLFNLKSTIVFHQFFFNIGINNLFDKIYATNADGTYGVRYYPGLPRTLQIGLSYKF